MSGFSADWLARREPYDRRARNPAVLDAVVSALGHVSALRIVDLACGTGSMLRELAPRFPGTQRWHLVDNDLGLLARAVASEAPAGITLAAMPLDLSRDLEAALDGPLDLVVTSALLDLVSEAWLDRLVVEVAARTLPFYAALSHDGRTKLVPADPFDAAIIAALNAHWRTDKGFGPALGPSAATTAIARFRSLGYSVVQGTSDWTVPPADSDMQLAIVDGWAGAACEAGVARADAMTWLSRRRDYVASGRSSIRVGHVDFWARQMAVR